MKALFRLGLMGIFLFTLSIKAFAENPISESQLMNMSIKDIMKVEVTSAGGREQKMDEVSNTMFVITKEDIERSGARQIPELFYMVPGMQVRQINGHQWAVSIRGEASPLTNNLLVLIDGAVVFNPGFNGTVWNALPVTIDEIERIEIIRGPGGILYSSNAVFGVIDIITKSSLKKDNYVAMKGGTQSMEQADLGMGILNKNSDFGVRTFFEHESDRGLTEVQCPNTVYFNTPYNSINCKNAYIHVNDSVDTYIGGVRLDYKPADDTSMFLTGNINDQGSYDNGLIGAILPFKHTDGTESLTGHVEHKFSDFYDVSMNADVVHQRLTVWLPNDADVTDMRISLQNNLHYDLFGGHVTSFGAELSRSMPDITRSGDIPSSSIQNYSILSAGVKPLSIESYFIQDEYRPFDQWIFTLGTRLDENAYVKSSGVLDNPRASVIYTPWEDQSFRAVASESNRTPSMVEKYLDFIRLNPSGNGAQIADVTGNLNLKPEEVTTYEVGYNGIFMDKKLEVDVAPYLTRMHDIIEISDWNTTSLPYHSHEVNDGQVRTKGIEFNTKYNINNFFSFLADYTYSDAKTKTEFPSHMVVEDVTMLSRHAVGAGIRFTENKFTADVYAKYYSAFAYQGGANNVSAAGIAGSMPAGFGLNQKEKGYLQPRLRLAYKFNVNQGKEEIELEVVASSMLWANQYQFGYTFRYTQAPDVYGGLKVHF